MKNQMTLAIMLFGLTVGSGFAQAGVRGTSNQPSKPASAKNKAPKVRPPKDKRRVPPPPETPPAVSAGNRSRCAGISVNEQRFECEKSEAVFEAAVTAYCGAGGDLRFCAIAKNHDRVSTSPEALERGQDFYLSNGYVLSPPSDQVQLADHPSCAGQTAQTCVDDIYFADQNASFIGRGAIAHLGTFAFGLANGRTFRKSDFATELEARTAGAALSREQACSLFEEMWKDGPRPGHPAGSQLYADCSDPDVSGEEFAPAAAGFSDGRCALVREVAKAAGCTLDNDRISEKKLEPRILAWGGASDLRHLVNPVLQDRYSLDAGTSAFRLSEDGSFMEADFGRIPVADWNVLMATLELMPARQVELYGAAARITERLALNTLFMAQLGYDSCVANVMPVRFAGATVELGFVPKLYGYTELVFGRNIAVNTDATDCVAKWEHTVRNDPLLAALRPRLLRDTAKDVKESLLGYYGRHFR